MTKYHGLAKFCSSCVYGQQKISKSAGTKFSAFVGNVKEKICRNFGGNLARIL